MTGPNKIDRYELQEELGRGGMATVYRAVDTRLGRDVALKTLHPSFADDPEFSARFEREARIISSFDHAAIVPILDYGQFEMPPLILPYLVMRLMTGGSLADRLQAGPLTLTQTADILTPISEALVRAHENGIIHRDIKPGNILFDGDDNVYLADFGIAKLASETGTYLTQTGNAPGTPGYMSPEQARGGLELDGRSDVYALGVLLFQMLTGELPYSGTSLTDVLLKHALDPIPDIHALRPDLPTTVDDIIKTAMAKDREERYADPMALAQAVAAAATETAVAPPAPAERAVVDAAAAETPMVVDEADDAPLLAESDPVPGAAAAVAAPLDPAARVPTAAEMPDPPTPTAPPAGRRPGWANRRFAGIALGGVALLLAAIFLGPLLFGGDDEPELEALVEAPLRTATATATATAPATTAPTATATSPPATMTATPAPAATATPPPSATITLTPSPAATPTPNLPPADATLGDTWTRPADEMVMVFVPAGTFTMGSDTDGVSWTGPAHEVTLDAFWLDQTEVTNGQFSLFVDATGYVTTAEERGSSFNTETGQFEDGLNWQHPGGPGSDLSGLSDYPVIFVSWIDADAYCAWAGGRLPTEAEWEYAARGPEGYIYPWGNQLDETRANTRLNDADGYTTTAPVGTYPGGRSWVGADDMAGNVSEWVNDWSDLFTNLVYYENSPANNPTGPGTGTQKIYRGSSWRSFPEVGYYVLSSAYRQDAFPELGYDSFGFRCALPAQGQ